MYIKPSLVPRPFFFLITLNRHRRGKNSLVFTSRVIVNLQVYELVYGKIYSGLLKYTIAQIMDNAIAHSHYRPCNEYQAVFFLSVSLECNKKKTTWVRANETERPLNSMAIFTFA